MNARYGWVVVGAGALISLRGDGIGLFARDIPATDLGRHRMVTDRRVERRNLALRRHGLLGLRLGLAERPLGRAPR